MAAPGTAGSTVLLCIRGGRDAKGRKASKLYVEASTAGGRGAEVVYITQEDVVQRYITQGDVIRCNMVLRIWWENDVSRTADVAQWATIFASCLAVIEIMMTVILH